MTKGGAGEKSYFCILIYNQAVGKDRHHTYLQRKGKYHKYPGGYFPARTGFSRLGHR